MNIGQAADQSGLPAKTIRYYEDIELVVPRRRPNGYREYGDADIHKLRFVQRSRGLGFSIEQCRALLSLYGDSNRHSVDVKLIANSRIADIDRKIDELQSLRKTLKLLVAHCHGDDRPECPILDTLAGAEVAVVPS